MSDALKAEPARMLRQFVLEPSLMECLGNGRGGGQLGVRTNSWTPHAE